MDDDIELQRSDYSSREAFLEDIAILRNLKQLRNTSAFWDALEARLVADAGLEERLASIESRLEQIEATIATGQQ